MSDDTNSDTTKKRRVGRPTKYNDEMVEKARAYIESEYLSQADAIPSHPGMAKYLGVTRSTLYQWAEEHEDFSDTLEQLMDEQHRLTLSGGIRGDFNSTISKLVLNNHGYSDKVDGTLSAPDGGPVQIEYSGVKSDGKR